MKKPVRGTKMHEIQFFFIIQKCEYLRKDFLMKKLGFLKIYVMEKKLIRFLLHISLESMAHYAPENIV